MLGQYAKYYGLHVAFICHAYYSCVLKGNPSFLPVETKIHVTGSSNIFRSWKYAITSNSGKEIHLDVNYSLHSKL